MDPDLIKRILSSLRGSPQMAAAPQGQQPPMPGAPGLSQAMGAPMGAPGGAPVQGVQGSSSPMQFNSGLENQVNAQGGNNELEPILQQVMKRLGMMSMIRNRSNETMNYPG